MPARSDNKDEYEDREYREYRTRKAGQIPVCDLIIFLYRDIPVGRLHIIFDIDLIDNGLIRFQKPGGKIVRAQIRYGVCIEYTPRFAVGQPAFKAAADFDAHLPVAGGKQQQNA